MENVCKLVGIERMAAKHVSTGVKPRYSDVRTIDNINSIKPAIQDLLFVLGYDSVLCNYKNELWVLEMLNYADKSYSKFKVEYHPLHDLVSLSHE